MLQVYSTLTRKKEPFPKRPGEAVSMYVCGPTVYKPSHIGHMVGPVIFDTVKRYLTYLGYKVTWVVNITDVDDKLIARARELGTTVPELAERMTRDYFDCLQKLNVTGIDRFPRATEYIGGMVEMISQLIEKGYAYPAGGDVYFDVAKDADYGKLCNRDPEQLEAGSRIEVSDRKRNPGDFALWKGAKPGEPPEVQFDSPWGKGRPGWHIECSVMATKLLGDTLDIHGGGLDLQFPHHENELAQSESATGEPFARVWMHNGLLKMGTAKMAGSVGNVVNIADLLQRHTAETVRFLLLSTHYRSPIEYSEERLNEVKKSLEGFYRFFEEFERITEDSFYTLPEYDRAELGRRTAFTEIPSGEKVSPATLGIEFLAAMDDDFNTGAAIGVMFSTLNKANFAVDLHRKWRDTNPVLHNATLALLRRLARELRTMSNILGMFWEPRPKLSVEASLSAKWNVQATGTGVGHATATGGGQISMSAEEWNRHQAVFSGLIQLLIDLRNNLRTDAKGAAKDNPLKPALFAQTDLIRTRLAELGVTLEDRPGGTTWRVG